jgi:hypothetical protein
MESMPHRFVLFRRVVAPQLLGIATTASRVVPLPASTHGSRHLPPPRFFGRRARDHASHCAVVVALGASCLRIVRGRRCRLQLIDCRYV